MNNESDSTSWRAVGYREAVVTARDLCDPLEENRGGEYARGQIALIADMWGKRGMDTSTRMDEVEIDIFGPRSPEDERTRLVDKFLRERGVGPVGERDHNIMAIDLEAHRAHHTHTRTDREWAGAIDRTLDHYDKCFTDIEAMLLSLRRDIEQRLQHLESEDSRIETRVREDLERELKEAQTLIGDLVSANYDRMRDVDDLDNRVTDLESPTTDS